MSAILDDKNLEYLGAGMFGVAYKVSLNDKTYVLKKEKILSNDDYKRDLEFYDAIKTLPKSERKHFAGLIQYTINQDCKIDHVRPASIPRKPKNCKDQEAFCEFIDKMRARDKSKTCIEYLIEYKGKSLNNLSRVQLKSSIKQIVAQLCKIGSILTKMGYSHTDMHEGNICLISSSKKEEMIKDKIGDKVLISLIDYGLVINRNNFDNAFHLRKRNLYDVKNALNSIFLCGSLYIKFHLENKKKLPWEKSHGRDDILFQHVIKNFPELWEEIQVLSLRIWKKESVERYFQEYSERKKLSNMPQYILYWEINNFIYTVINLKLRQDAAKIYGWETYIRPLFDDLSIYINLYRAKSFGTISECYKI